MVIPDSCGRSDRKATCLQRSRIRAGIRDRPERDSGFFWATASVIDLGGGSRSDNGTRGPGEEGNLWGPHNGSDQTV